MSEEQFKTVRHSQPCGCDLCSGPRRYKEHRVPVESTPQAEPARHPLEHREPTEPSRLTKFDDAIKTVTDQRGSVYGHPRHDFDRADRLKAVVAECKDPLARHALEMICVKVARLIQTPTHLDSWIDIAGYARTGVMVTEK